LSDLLISPKKKRNKEMIINTSKIKLKYMENKLNSEKIKNISKNI
jgi:hypothetical protein